MVRPLKNIKTSNVKNALTSTSLFVFKLRPIFKISECISSILVILTLKCGKSELFDKFYVNQQVVFMYKRGVLMYPR